MYQYETPTLMFDAAPQRLYTETDVPIPQPEPGEDV